MRSVPPICRHSFFFVRKVFFCNAFSSCLYFIHPHFSLWNFWLHMRIPRFGLQFSGLSFMPLSFPLSSELLLPLDPSTFFIFLQCAKLVLSLESLHLLCFRPGMASLSSFPAQPCFQVYLSSDAPFPGIPFLPPWM